MTKSEGCGWFSFGLILFLVLIVVLSATGVVGRVVNVVVEREVFERSYQYSEGKNAQIATYRAELAKLQEQLNNPNLTEEQILDIHAQLTALEIQIRTAIELQTR